VIGAAAGALIGFVRSAGAAERAINPLREQFVQLHGGLAALNVQAHSVGMTLDAMLNAKNAEQYTKAIADLNAAFDAESSGLALLDETAAKYGLTLAELGPKYAQGKLDEQFLQLFQDQKILSAGGVDYDLILQKQASSFQTLIDTALLTGATIPAAMRPAIEHMIELGLLTDASGEKMTGLEGLTFADTLDAKFTTLIATIEKLANAIAGKLGTALAAIPTTVDVDVNLNGHYTAPDMPEDHYAARGGLVTSTGMQYFGAGGNVLPFRARGSDTVPAMLTPGEMVLTRAQQAGLVRGQAPTTAAMEQKLDHLDRRMAARDRALPKMIRDALLLAS
jgi:hypothetical protein